MSDDAQAQDISKLASAFSEFRGEMRSEIKHLGHDVKNINTKLDAYPTHRDLKVVENRVAHLEEKAKWTFRTGIGFALSVIGSAIAAYLKFSG
jgi:hypothetical protein